MTVISTIISQHGIAFASDSFLTKLNKDGSLEITETQQSKIVRIEKFRAAVAYWGLALYEDWSTFDWLEIQARNANDFKTLEEFAVSLRDNLKENIKRLRLDKDSKCGIGLHLAGYEFIGDYWIPELFLCSNFKNTNYNELCCLSLSRETLKYVSTEEPPEQKQREACYRLKIHKFLQSGCFLSYNNGDPSMFNPVADAFSKSIDVLRERGILKIHDKESFRSFAKRPVEVVSDVQRDFCKDGKRVVGGKPHDLVITPGGEYSSDSGS